MTSGRHFRNPVSLAKLIMNDTYHCGLSGEGALKFAKQKGFPVTQDVKKLISKTAEKTKVSYDDFVDYVNVTMRGRPVTNRDNSRNMVSAAVGEDSGETTSAIPGDFSGGDDTSSAVVRSECSDTVSAVARDIHGHFACAVSTGMICHDLYFSVKTVLLVKHFRIHNQ